jgi:hypothetical protein
MHLESKFAMIVLVFDGVLNVNKIVLGCATIIPAQVFST